MHTDSVRPGVLKALDLVLPLVLALVLTLFAYAGSLSAGFLYDDPLDLPRAGGRSLVEIFTSAGESGYFRPLSLTLWKISYELAGRYDPVVLRAWVVALHVLNGWLVYQLARRLVDPVAGLVATALFVWFPFSYQVVSNVNAIFHALVTALVLLAVLLYWEARRQTSRAAAGWRLGLALGVTGLAVLTHENGLVVVPAVLAVEAALRLTHRVHRLTWWPALFLAEAAAWLLLWWLVPRWRTNWSLDPESLRLNGLYFLQGLGYPVTGWLTHLWPGGGSGLKVFLVTAVTLLVVSGLLIARRRLVALGFGLVWFLAAVLPAWILLPWSYVVDGPRLLYLASVGVAILWGAALAPVMARRHWSRYLNRRKLGLPLGEKPPLPPHDKLPLPPDHKLPPRRASTSLARRATCSLSQRERARVRAFAAVPPPHPTRANAGAIPSGRRQPPEIYCPTRPTAQSGPLASASAGDQLSSASDQPAPFSDWPWPP